MDDFLKGGQLAGRRTLVLAVIAIATLIGGWLIGDPALVNEALRQLGAIMLGALSAPPL